MPKSEVIVDVVNGAVPLEQSLRRLEVLAHDVGNTELEHWAECELSGYRDEEVPEYRMARNCLTFSYSGINGSFNAKNVSLDISFLSEETLDQIKDVRLSQGIEFIERLAGGDPMTYADRSFLASEIAERSQGALRCYSVRQGIPTSVYAGVVSEVTTRVIKALTMMEDQYGVLDDLGIEVASKRATNEGNANINNVVLYNQPMASDEKDEKLGSKVVWKFVVPVAVAVISALLSGFAVKHFGL